MDHDVRSAVIQTGLEGGANLKIDHKSMEARFGRLFDEVVAELRLEKIERRTREALRESLDLSHWLSYAPSSNVLESSPLIGRVTRG